MRRAALAAVVLTGCVSFHPRNPPWRQRADADGQAVAEAAAARPASTVSSWETIGRSHEGRPLRVRRVGDGPRRVIWIGGIHGNEISAAMNAPIDGIE